MKMTINWHKECLENSKRYEQKLRKELEQMQAKINHIKIENEQYERQIARAEELKKDDFDKEKFGIPVKKFVVKDDSALRP